MALDMIDIKSVVTKSGASIKKFIQKSDSKEVWSAGSIVTYYVDTGTAYTEEVDNGASCLSPASFTPTKSGWSFVGWREDATASAEVLTEKIMETEPITLYAVFTQTVTVTYYNASTTAVTSTGSRYYNIGNVVDPSFTLTQATKSGWNPVGWSTGSAGNAGIAYENGATFTRDSNVTLYGRYNQVVTVTYYDNSTTATSTNGTRCYNSSGNVVDPSFTLAQASKSGWTARGWSTGTAGNSAIAHNNGVAFTRDSNVTLYGCYQKTVTLYYNGNGATGGSVANDSKTAYYNSSGNVVNPTFTLANNGYSLSGYSFIGWATTGSATSGVSAGTTVTLSASTTYFAVWKINALSLLSASYFTANDYTSVTSGSVKIDKGAYTDKHEITVYSGYVANAYTSLRMAGNYLIGSKSSTPTQFVVTLENSSGISLLAEPLLSKTLANGGSEHDAVTESANFDKTFDISGISGSFRIKVYMYERYTDTTDNYINFTALTLS